MEAAPIESTDSSVVPADEDPENNIEVEKPEHPKPKLDNFKCQRCTKAFRSGPALCGHQNAHRIISKDPNKVISPVLAAVLNNPLPGDDPELFNNLVGTNKEKKVSKKKQKQPASATAAAGNKSCRHHPYRKGKKKLELPVQIIEETASSDTPPVAEGVDLLEEEIIQMNAGISHPNYYYHPFERVELQLLPQPPLPVYNSEEHSSRPQRVTLDLLGEWAPLSGFGLGGDHGQPGTSYQRNSSGGAALEIGLRRARNAPLDLELKLGFGPGF